MNNASRTEVLPMQHPMRKDLPPLPPKMAHVPIDERGFPVPWFVDWIDGKPDHRIMDSRKLPLAIKHNLCWMCGTPLGTFKSFVIGPMCSITRSISEPPSHLECARYACMACPWMTRPHAKRREANMPENALHQAGLPILRNPGACCVWTTKTFKPYRTGRGGEPGNEGILFELGDPTSTEWYAEGRPAYRAEVDASIASGLHLLIEQAVDEDKDEAIRKHLAVMPNTSMKALEGYYNDAQRILDAVAWPAPAPAPQEDRP